MVLLMLRSPFHWQCVGPGQTDSEITALAPLKCSTPERADVTSILSRSSFIFPIVFRSVYCQTVQLPGLRLLSCVGSTQSTNML